MRSATWALVLALAGCGGATGVEITATGDVTIDQLSVVASYGGRTVSRDVPTSPSPITLPTSFVAELPASGAEVTFDLVGKRGGSTIATASTGALTVGAGVLKHVTVELRADSYAAVVLADHPVVYYRLDETSGTVAVDSSGNHHDATYGSAVTHVAGLLTHDSDGAAQLPGGAWAETGVVRLERTTALEVEKSLTVEAWVRPTSADLGSGDREFVYYQGQDTLPFKEPYHLASNVTAVSFVVTPLIEDHAGGAIHVGTLVAGVAHHLVGTYDGQAASVYLDGTLAVTKPATSAIADYGSNGLALGGRYAGDASTDVLFGGVIDEVAIYDTALPASRIATHYQAGTQ